MMRSGQEAAFRASVEQLAAAIERSSLTAEQRAQAAAKLRRIAAAGLYQTKAARQLGRV